MSVAVPNVQSIVMTVATNDKHPFQTTNSIRTFIESLKGKTITQDKNILVWGQMQTLLSKHPTWKDKIDTIEAYMITTGFNKTCTVLKIKPVWSKKYITISWRKCKPPRIQKTRITDENTTMITDENTTGISEKNTTMIADENTTRISEENTTENKSNVSQFTTSEKSITPQLSGAMRSAIGRQIATWKRDNQVFRRCRQCQSSLNLHVDHVIPFVQLQRDFLQYQPCIPTSFFYMRKTCQPRFTDKGFARKWQYFHKKHAQLQWLCRVCNLKKGSSGQAKVRKLRQEVAAESNSK